MLPKLKGPKPFAVVLCRFADISRPSLSPSEIADFVAQIPLSHRDTLFQYWRDVSYGNISLGQAWILPETYLDGNWYLMQYTSAQAASGKVRRGDVIAEARRLGRVK